MTKFISEPSVEVVAMTKINWEGLQQWAIDQELVEVLHTDGTPLGILWHDLMDNKDVSLDALPEFAGRHCYRSFEKGRPRFDYIKNIIEMEHGSVLEHATVSMTITGVSRSLSLELIRHKAGTGVSQESQRYVDAEQVNFIIPPLINKLGNPFLSKDFEDSCIKSLNSYKELINFMGVQTTTGISKELGVKLATMRKKRILEAARAVLPNAAETRLTWTMNMRAARHICALRGGEGADLEIRNLAVVMLGKLKEIAPIVFDDFEVYEASDGFKAIKTPYPKV